MKPASAATLSILASGQYYIIECFQIYLPHSQLSYYFTAGDVNVTVGGNTYQTGLTIKRGTLTQKAGLEVQTLDLEITPQPDSYNAPVTIEGFPFLQACRNGDLDAARITMSKLILSNVRDTSPGLVPWFQGRAHQIDAGRVMAKISVASDLALLNVSMPRNVLQVGCLHDLFDVNCLVNRNSFTWNGTVTSGGGSPTVFTFGTNLNSVVPVVAQANDYFDLGTITFTTGANASDSRTIKISTNANGAITVIFPWATAPSVGDQFSISAGCDKLQGTCSSKFNNLIHFRGYPYVPAPETLYDGGTDTPYHQVLPYNTPGTVQGFRLPGTYKP